MSTGRPAAPTENRDGEDLGGHRPGDVVAGKYLLLGVIGCGGMGTVWSATNQDLDLEVAVKLVNRGLDSEETRARLATEARAEARVQHRGIVRVLDLGVTDEGEPFLVMERLAGRSLGELLDECGHLESTDAVRIMLPVLEALGAVHERGVVHRDLKPDNIFLSEHGGRIQPKIVDFGIAKLESAPTPRCTGRGAVVGSPGYMAPEHARGVDVDHRADIFTASLVLYESITGHPAFEGTNYNALLRAVIERKLEPITSFGRGDPALSRILERGLRKDPDKRYSSCLELGRALATWLLSQGESEDVTGHPLSDWWLQDQPGASLRSTHRSSPPAQAIVRRTRSRSERRGETGRAALESMRAVSFSTSEVAPVRPVRRRLAFIALACSGFLGGFAATTASDFFPWQTHGAESRVAAASTAGTKPPATATEIADAPVVPTVSIATVPATTTPPAKTTADAAKKLQEPRAVPPLTRPMRRKKTPVSPADLRNNPFDSMRAQPPEAAPPQEAPRPALTLPPDPPPPGALLKPQEADLKDPYQ